MKIFRELTILLIIITSVYGCSSSKKVFENSADPEIYESINLDTVIIEGKIPVYHASEKRENDLIHTKLEIEFDWNNQYVIGKAFLKLKPYFYPTQNLTLDAKGFDINEIAIIKSGFKERLDYRYDNKEIEIDLDRTYNKNESFEIFIDYIAKPNEKHENGGSAAITDDKGLYFIDPLDTLPEKPSQIWTQGETESSSCWFPTIDAPNERTSQEIFLTVDNKYKTISNGKLMSSKVNANGSRTDYWKQKLPHAPYLFMIAVGEFAEIKDQWNGIETNYYVGKEYGPYAKNIFGNTGEMLQFFGQKFGLEYPWDKYHQVVVEDFVSGAMENTGAVIHYDGLHQTDRELLDENHEDIIAHEAAHHWFGDYVTCENWANIPLNESFATFAEIMWERYKYGDDAAAYKIMKDRNDYFAESMAYKAPLIRYYYDDKEDMFDRHSYQKGGQVLLMLEDYVGEEAFYLALQKYLKDNALQAVEIHNLRLAFESVTGEDLNWFFNQWFLKEGHPILKVSQHFDKELGQVVVSVLQKQEEKPFILPVTIAIHTGAQILHKEVLIDSRKEVFSFKCNDKPKLVDFDTNSIILGEIEYELPAEALAYSYHHSNNMIKRYDALVQLESLQEETIASNVFVSAINDPSDYIRETAVRYISYDHIEDKEQFKNKLINVAERDSKSLVRAAALDKMKNTGIEMDEYKIVNLTNDRSYSVSAAALELLSKNNPDKAIEISLRLLNNKEKNSQIIGAISTIFSKYPKPEFNNFYRNQYEEQDQFGKMRISNTYSDYLSTLGNTDLINSATEFFENNAKNEKAKWLRYKATESLYILRTRLVEKNDAIQNKIEGGDLTSVNKSDINLSKEFKKIIEKISLMIKEIKAEEKDADVKLYYNFLQ